jgi:hypothetical protein
MKMNSIRMANKTSMKNGDNDLNRIAIPISIATNPRYIGFLLNLKTPPWISALDFSNGLTVVFTFLNARSAEILIPIPNKIGKRPVKCQGGLMM